jgi:hypothetical protein
MCLAGVCVHGREGGFHSRCARGHNNSQMELLLTFSGL